jgi:hypothetical protein
MRWSFDMDRKVFIFTRSRRSPLQGGFRWSFPRPEGCLKAWAILLDRFAVRSNRLVYKAQAFRPGSEKKGNLPCKGNRSSAPLQWQWGAAAYTCLPPALGVYNLLNVNPTPKNVCNAVKSGDPAGTRENPAFQQCVTGGATGRWRFELYGIMERYGKNGRALCTIISPRKDTNGFDLI